MACRTDFRSAIIAAAQSVGVDPTVALSVAQTESGTCQWTASGAVITSSAGALGIMQLMPATAAQLGVDPRDPYQNITGGVRYLRMMLDRYGSYPLALAAYNMGPGALDSILARGGTIPGAVQQYVAQTNQSGGVTQQMPAPMPATFAEADQPNFVLGYGAPAPPSVNPFALFALLAGGLALTWVLD